MNEKTREILDFFKEISSIPRCSRNEQNISRWLQQWAENNSLEVQNDATGNLKINIGASRGYENAPAIVFQGHMDMVCEKSRDSNHDFTKDPIQLIYDGDWLHADGTTLGADNGIALAMGMALAAESSAEHPSLELLFTVNEETGLNGAKQLEPGFIKGKILLNVDSETEGVFTVGCAGGRDTIITYQLNVIQLPKDMELFKLTVQGLNGGHSGVDIHRQRANANKILARALHQLNTSCRIQLASFQGGTSHNAIPRDASATLACQPAQISTMQQIVSEFKQTVQKEYALAEKNMALSLAQIDKNSADQLALTADETARVIHLLLALPHGVRDMSLIFKDLVETSCNLAFVDIKNSTLQILTSQRSSVASKLDDMAATVQAAASLLGAETRTENEYSPWQPNMDSALLQRCKDVYQRLFNQEPVVEAIHAGLECAVIGSKYEGIDMVSFGATLENPHSPNERLFIPSIERVWTFLIALLKSFKS
ncbi:MAG: aminoacyl-histidine dipeptidase [Desulfobacterales bacterium]|nr:MAG: aminoacyl-histidine dipeptidase [Desulfobacterales bacterium]